MRLFLFILFIPLVCFSQYPLNKKFPFKTKLVTDSGTIKGYYVSNTDSTITVSSDKRYLFNRTNIFTIPAEKINSVEIKSRPGNAILSGLLITVIGFGVAAGLTNHGGDVDGDGKTSFFELLLAAIEGSTSRDRRRRNRALIVGAAGGFSFAMIWIISDKKLSLKLPVKGRSDFFRENEYDIRKHVQF